MRVVARCDYCDKHPATGTGKYPDMCEFCHTEFIAVMGAIRARCETCPTPFSCMIHRKCGRSENDASENNSVAVPSDN